MMGIFGQIRSVNPFGGEGRREKTVTRHISLSRFFFDKDVSIFFPWASQMKRCLLKEVNLWGHPPNQKMCCRTPTPIPRTTKGKEKKKNQTNWRSMQSSCSSSVRYGIYHHQRQMPEKEAPYIIFAKQRRGRLGFLEVLECDSSSCFLSCR